MSRSHGFTLTYPTSAVLLAVRHGHGYGFGIMDATGLPDGTVYPILRRLEDRGALTALWEDEARAHAEGRPPRRYYRLTAAGEAAAADARTRFPALERIFRSIPQGTPEGGAAATERGR